MNREQLGGWDTEEIAAELEGSALTGPWNQLTDTAGDEAAWLLREVCRIQPPARIRELRNLEIEQNQRGAGFYGMLPDQVPEDLDAPVDINASLTVACRLAEIRKANLDALRNTMPQYALEFTGEGVDHAEHLPLPDDWKLDLDVEGFRALLDALGNPNLDTAEATRVAGMPAFTEMLRHRRELGYVPEPLIDEEGLAWCIVGATSQDSIHVLWRWLHPQNLFDLADVARFRDAYRRLLDRITSDHGGVAHRVLSRIADFVPETTTFRDRLSFSVGWGIRGWATNETGGVNLEHIKDDDSNLLTMLVHETFHRLQIQLCPSDPTSDAQGFEQITSDGRLDGPQKQLYQALCYIMLEGSATYVSDPIVQEAWQDNARTSLDLLDRILHAEADEAEELMTVGLRSNGPFYGFGALLSSIHREHRGTKEVGHALQHGAPTFVGEGLRHLKGTGLEASAEVSVAIDTLQRTLRPSPGEAL